MTGATAPLMLLLKSESKTWRAATQLLLIGLFHQFGTETDFELRVDSMQRDSVRNLIGLLAVDADELDVAVLG